MAKVLDVLKRNGEAVAFNQAKIQKAIQNAYLAVYPYGNSNSILLKSNALASEVVGILDIKLERPTVEDIQDVVEDVLLETDKKVAKAYIRYRKLHTESREESKAVSEVKGLFDKYIKKTDWKTNENANMTFSLQGLNNYIVSELTENYWLNEVYPESIRNAHLSGDFHVHDLGLFAPYCCGWSLEQLLTDGFCGVEGKVESAPPKHFRVALGQIVNFLYTLQGEAAGAQAFSNFDTYLAPFVREDGLKYKEVKQGIQEFVYQLNVSTRVGFQTPFTNITMDLTIPSNLAYQPVIIGGEPQMDKVYGDYQNEVNMINLAFAEVMMGGDAKGRMFSFPIPTYNIDKTFDWDNPVLDNVMEMTAKYGIPYFANYVNSDMNPEDARSMCCRLRLDNRQLRKRGGGLFGSSPMTGSIGVVTLNLSRIGYLAKTEEEFLERVKYLMDLAKLSLEIKRELLEKNTEMGLYPYSKFYLRDIHKRFGSYWANHFNTIGLNGMNEAIMNFFGSDENIATEKGKAFAEKVLDFMRDVIQAYQEDSDNIMYNLEATPAEGTGYKLALKDKKQFPEIITSGDREPFYTNSTQLPVDFTTDLFEALDLQESLQTKYTGGTVFHGFAGERIHDIQVMKDLLRKVMTNYKIPYFTFTPTFSICPDHGYIDGEHFACPTCKRETEVWTRVVGFHRPVKQWNKGKQEEFSKRKMFEIV